MRSSRHQSKNRLGLVSSVVFWIRDILVRIWIRRPVPLTYGSGSCSFRHWPSKCQQNMSYVAYYFSKVHGH